MASVARPYRSDWFEDCRFYPHTFQASSVNHWTQADVAGISFKIAAFALAFAFYPSRRTVYAFAGYELARYIIQRVIMIGFFPLQSRIVKYFVSQFRNGKIDNERLNLASPLKRKKFQVEHVGLKINGVTYSALQITHPNNENRWVLQATGNGEPIEHSAVQFAEIYKEMGLNVLLVNGPGVGRSGGHATPSTMGDAQFAGIAYLENELKAKQIVSAGRSLGGAAIGQAILKYPFNKKELQKYLVIRQMSFSSVSKVCAEFVGKICDLQQAQDHWIKKIVSGLVWWTGLEMDCVAVSRKLADLGIHEIIVQAGHADVQLPEKISGDRVIPKEASLAYHVYFENMAHKTFLFSSEFHKVPAPNGEKDEEGNPKMIETAEYAHMTSSSISVVESHTLIKNYVAAS